MSLMTPSTVVEVGKPFVLVVLPWLRYAAMARPEAMPVILGCGIAFMYLLLFGLFFLYARRAVFRGCPFLVERVRAFDAL